MKFDKDKWHLLLSGNRNYQAIFKIINILTTSVDKRKIFCVRVSPDLKPSKQCTEVVKIENKLVSFIGRSFTCEYEKKITLLTIYNSHVHPHLKYKVLFWSTYAKKYLKKNRKNTAQVNKIVKQIL